MNDLVLPFQPSCQNGGGAVYRAECVSKVLVTIEHKDTLGRPLPAGNIVELCDAHRYPHTGVTDDRGHSHHPGVIAGPFAWQLRDAPGRHLIAIDEVPVHPVASGLSAPEALAVMNETTVVATYLPPPMLIDLHTPSEGVTPDLLSDDQLEQLRLAGNNATLFLHGYNVPRGDWARFDAAADAASARPPPLLGTALLHPSGAAAISTLCQRQSIDGDEQGLNGTGACGWLTSMEYQLNRAAGMDESDWRPYSRVVGIAWPGDTGATAFTEAEFIATHSGRRLVNVLKQLLDAGIKINLIGHSLGARVALTALNLLGERGVQQRIDHLFLWQPAVADNALSPDTPFSKVRQRDELFKPDPRRPGREVHPLGMGTFPYAHRAVSNIVVLHSHEDGVLGPSNREASGAWYDPRDWVQRLRDIATDSSDDRTGTLGGAYTKKWWTFPPIIAGGLGYFREYYFNRGRALAPGQWEAALLLRTQDDASDQYRVDRAWEALTQALVDEARRILAATPPGPLHADTCLPDYDLLKPLAHHARISEQMALTFAQHLRELGQKHNWQPGDGEVRPALGLVGFKDVETEPFFETKLRLEIFDEVDQSTWLFEHSAMKYPSKEIFTKSYKLGIMDRIKGGSGFGQY
ncbi:alpha/beta hydrolase [Halomonas sp. PR-M31]|uniref:alpha/beta hydrolase n=1 Tax=Halomonas sp. PR-M31 TaxID=1471202 RepID=UPI00065114C0|nr:alpha/beta hydrolase [Halomonas sp. PR-M31]